MMSGRFVAPIMKTFFFELIPSISVSTWLITRSAAPPGEGRGGEGEREREREREGKEGRREGRGDGEINNYRCRVMATLLHKQCSPQSILKPGGSLTFNTRSKH